MSLPTRPVERRPELSFNSASRLAGDFRARVSGAMLLLRPGKTYLALDSAPLLTAISAPQAEEIERMKMELLLPSRSHNPWNLQVKGEGAKLVTSAKGALAVPGAENLPLACRIPAGPIAPDATWP